MSIDRPNLSHPVAAKIRERVPPTSMDGGVLDAQIRSEIVCAYQALAIAVDLALPPSELLLEALIVRCRLHLGLAFRLFQIRYPAKTIALVYSNLDSVNKAMRANARIPALIFVPASRVGRHPTGGRPSPLERAQPPHDADDRHQRAEDQGNLVPPHGLPDPHYLGVVFLLGHGACVYGG